MFERLVLVQGRDGNLHHLAIPENVLPMEPTYHAAMLRITLPIAAEEVGSTASAFFAASRDPSNCVLSFLDPDSWLEFERSCSGSRKAVGASLCWRAPVMEEHSLRYPPEERKAAYVRHRKAVWRVAKAFEDLRRFARSPGSVFNPGASLADTFRAEQRAGVVFPDEARVSFTLFDGQAHSAWLRSEGVIGGFELLSLDEAVEVMLEEVCFRRASGTPPDFVPLASKRNSSEWLAAAVETGRVCVMKPLMRPKTVARSWSHYLRVQ